MTFPGSHESTLETRRYNQFLLIVSGLGGLLYGVDVGIIGSALPYLEATSGFNPSQLSFVVAAVLLGSVIATLFAGILADRAGRKHSMIISGALFAISIPVIAVSHSFGALVTGRLLQGVSAGLIGVVVPLYLAECLSADRRGRGTGIFQWMLTLGLVAAAAIGIYFSIRVDEATKTESKEALRIFKEFAWRRTFWVSLPPGILFVLGAFFVAESPRWLLRRGQKEAARRALLKSRTAEQADRELSEMEAVLQRESAQGQRPGGTRESLLQKKYIIPFVLACIILACNQATGVNSIIQYHTTILLQSGLSDVNAHWGYLLLTSVNFLVTMAGVALVDRRGRKFLLTVGSAGIIVSLVAVAFLFRQTEAQRIDCRDKLQALVDHDQHLSLSYNATQAAVLLAGTGMADSIKTRPSTLTVIYAYGDFRAATSAVRSDDGAAKPVSIERADCVPANGVLAFFSNPFGDLKKSRIAPLTIEHALITPIPSVQHGWLTAIGTFCFMAFFAVGPGVCVWLALSELMPTRIRSNGMSIALLINQGVSTISAAIFLPTVGKYGYSTMFFIFAGCTIVYFITAAFFLPETKGRTLEEIEAHFAGTKKAADASSAAVR